MYSLCTPFVIQFLFTCAASSLFGQLTATVFSAERVGVSWKTSEFPESSLHILEKSIDGAYFETIALRDPQGKADFTIIEELGDETAAVMFRLRYVGSDGMEGISKTTTLDLDSRERPAAVTFSAHPNPAKGHTLVRGTHNSQMKITNSAGQLMGEWQLPASGELRLDMSSWAVGCYFCTCTSSAGQVKRLRLVKW